MANILVPDASVILKWVLRDPNEKDQEKALQLRDLYIEGRVILKVPSLWFYEVGNTLSRLVPSDSQELLEALSSFGLEEAIWNKTWLDKCLTVVDKCKVTFYDAAYHSLALIEKGIFITADSQYVKKTKSIGSVKNINSLSINKTNRSLQWH
jgi:predicted nucleic acid-binding protein